MAILVVERTQNGYLRVVDLAAMLYSSAFVPVTPSMMAGAERRIFETPLRMLSSAL